MTLFELMRTLRPLCAYLLTRISWRVCGRQTWKPMKYATALHTQRGRPRRR